MFLLAKPEIKMLLLLILMFELNHKNWERIADVSKGNWKNILPNSSFLYRSLVHFSVTLYYNPGHNILAPFNNLTQV